MSILEIGQKPITNKKDIELIKVDVESVKVDLTNTKNDLTTTKNKVNENTTQITNIKDNIGSINTNIESIKQKNTEQDNEINAIKQKNTEQDSEINAIKNINTTQTNEINSIKQKNTQQDSSISGIDSRVRTLENKPGTDLSGLTQRVSTNETDIRTNASNIRGLESAKGQVYLTYEKRVFVALSNKVDESVNIGGLDITRFDITFDMIEPLTYITNMQTVFSNFFIITFVKYSANVYRVVFAKKTGTTYPSSISMDIDYIRLISQVDGRTGEIQ